MVVSPVRGTPVLVAEPPEGALEGHCPRLGGASDRLWEGRRLMAHSHGQEAHETGLLPAALVVATALMAVLVAEAAFHSGDLAGEPAHGALHHGLDPVDQLVVRGTVAVGLARHSQASLLPA
jgi:hypothetical protein